MKKEGILVESLEGILVESLDFSVQKSGFETNLHEQRLPIPALPINQKFNRKKR